MIIQNLDFIVNYFANGFMVMAFFGLAFFVLWIAMLDRRDK